MLQFAINSKALFNHIINFCDKLATDHSARHSPRESAWVQPHRCLKSGVLKCGYVSEIKHKSTVLHGWQKAQMQARDMVEARNTREVTICSSVSAS